MRLRGGVSGVKLRLAVLVALLVGFTLPGLARADYAAGFAAYERSDYATAYLEIRKAAEQGHSSAQSGLGAMYYEGLGVPQDYAEAVKWYRKAAEQGNSNGQFNLGGMYYEGLGVPRDFVQAHMWFSLAADRGIGRGQTGRDRAAANMTPAQLAEAQALAAAWKPVTEGAN